MKMRDTPVCEACFGFAAPDDRVVSLNIPAAREDGRKHPFSSFEIEYDPEQPDMVVISLLELDEDNFIHTVQRSISFPVKLLAELLSRRKATPEEIAAWHAAPDEDD